MVHRGVVGGYRWRVGRWVLGGYGWVPGLPSRAVPDLPILAVLYLGLAVLYLAVPGCTGILDVPGCTGLPAVQGYWPATGPA